VPSEFEIIGRYFTRPARTASLGVGDDAALVRTTPGTELAVSTDLLVEGRHFRAGADPRKLGHKALAVNLSDLAAMGATPRWATLALSMPEADETWVAAFAEGLFALADRFGTELIGGDTVRGPRSMCICILGEVPQGRALRRDGARADDDVWVSGELGGAALALVPAGDRRSRAQAGSAGTQGCARNATPPPRHLGDRCVGRLCTGSRPHPGAIRVRRAGALRAVAEMRRSCEHRATRTGARMRAGGRRRLRSSSSLRPRPSAPPSKRSRASCRSL
jgi:thiamin-phosphate kinase